MELVSRHRISSGGKKKRQFIEPGQRFRTEDYKDVSEKEWQAMLAQGTVMHPTDPSYASVTGLQSGPVIEGRITASQPEPEEDADEAEEKPKNGRRGRRRAAAEDDGEEL